MINALKSWKVRTSTMAKKFKTLSDKMSPQVQAESKAIGEKILAEIPLHELRRVPIKPMKKLKGFLKGIDTGVKRDKDRL